MFTDPACPNLTDFLTFLSESVQIPSAALPGNSPWPLIAFEQAKELVLYAPYGMPYARTLAVYNCATHILFQIAADVQGQNYFTEKRSNRPGGYALVMVSTGLIESASDQGTSGANVPPVWADKMTVGQLQFMKTMWGRAYLDYIQAFGPNTWGLS